MEGLANYLRYLRELQYPTLPETITPENVNVLLRNARRYADASEPEAKTLLELVSPSSYALVGVPWLLSLGATVTLDALYYCKHVSLVQMMLKTDPKNVNLRRRGDRPHLLASYWAVTDFEWFRAVVDAGFDVRNLGWWEPLYMDAQRFQYLKSH